MLLLWADFKSFDYSFVIIELLLKMAFKYFTAQGAFLLTFASPL